MLNLIIAVVVIYALTGRSSFWPWIGSRSGGQLIGITLFLSVIVFVGVQLAGYGA